MPKRYRKLRGDTAYYPFAARTGLRARQRRHVRVLRTAGLAALALAALLYARLFGWTDWGSLALPALVILAPPLVFALGSGWLLGRLKPWLLYVWMAAPVLLAVLPLPEVLGLWDGSFFTAYPLTLEGLDPAFTLPGPMVMAQLLLLAAGAVLLALGERSGAAKQKSSW